MRVQAGQRETRVGDAELRQRRGREANRLRHQRRREQRRDLPERDVHGDQHDLELGSMKQHGHVINAAQMGEQIGVALPVKSCL